MFLYFIEIISFLIFWKFADFKRLQEMIPILFTAAFLRFLEHYVVIDWFQLWSIQGHPIWTPLSANMSIWLFSAYLFIQYLPKSLRLLYGLAWVIVMFGYLYLIKTLGTFTIIKNWKMYYSFILVCFNYCILYMVWSWLYKSNKMKTTET